MRATKAGVIARDPDLTEALDALALDAGRAPNLAEWRDFLQSLELLCVDRRAQLDDARSAEQELKNSKEIAEAANRAKDVFLANMSHELRTPLTVMLGWVQVLLESRIESDQRQMLETVNRSGTQLLGIINDILDYCKLESGHFEIAPRDMSLKETIAETCAPFADRARLKGLELRVTIDAELPARVRGDEPKLKQALSNLVSNAVKFTERGTISVEARLLRETDDQIELYIGVTDTGIGIAEAVAHQLFQPFAQADASSTRRFGGAGLGLVIAKRIVGQMGGRIGVESAPGSGSKFWFVLNLTRVPDPAPSAKSKRGSNRAPEYWPLVLVAEDNEFNQALIRRVLMTLQCRVQSVSDGEEAVRAVLNGDFDVVLMDCQMPGLDGFDAARTIRAQEPPGRHTPIIAITASVMHGDKERCLEAGMDEYVAKPFSVDELRRKVERWIGTPSVKIEVIDPASQSDQSSRPRSDRVISASALDLNRLESLVEESGSREIVDELADIFVHDIEARLAVLTREVRDGERIALARGAHAIRGAAANFGATRMSDLSARLERDAETVDEATLMHELHELYTEYARVCVELRALTTPQGTDTLPSPQFLNKPND